MAWADIGCGCGAAVAVLRAHCTLVVVSGAMTARPEVFAVNPESTIAHEQESDGELLPRIVADIVNLPTLPCVVMAFVAFNAGRRFTSRPQPVVTRKRKRHVVRQHLPPQAVPPHRKHGSFRVKEDA